MQLNLTNISYTYPGTASPAIREVSATFPSGWTGVIGDSGCGKSTLARIAARLIEPDSGAVGPKLFSVYCQQDSSLAPGNLIDFASDWGQGAQRARTLLHIEDGWPWRYDALSGGQQKRLQIACALFARPDVLVMDEPTNDLDAAAREVVREALASFDGIGILISHDRELLDGLVGQSLLCEDARWTMRPGGYSKASSQATSERAAALRDREKAVREAKRLNNASPRYALGRLRRRLSTSEMNPEGSSTEKPTARTCFSPSIVRTAAGRFDTIQTFAW